MISRELMRKTIKRLEQHFAPLTQHDDEYIDKLEDYYRAFESTDEYLFSKGIDHLVDTHPYKSFPLIADVRDAIDFIRRTMTVYKPQETGCASCRGEGQAIDPDDGLVKCCSCARGQSLRAARAKHDSEHSYFRAPNRRDFYKTKRAEAEEPPAPVEQGVAEEFPL